MPRVKQEDRQDYRDTTLSIPELTTNLLQRGKLVFPRIKVLCLRYSVFLLLMVTVSNFFIFPLNFFTFSYFYHNILIDTLDTRITIKEIQNNIKFIENVNDEYGSMSNIIDMELNLGQDNNFSIFSDDLDYDFDLNLNIFCNSALDEYLIINYDFLLNLKANSTVVKNGIFILNCREVDQDIFFHIKDLFPNWLNAVLFSEFFQNLALLQTYEKNNYKIQMLDSFSSEVNSFENLHLTLTHNYNSNVQNTVTHDHFQFLIDPARSNISITKDLTTIKRFLRNFKYLSLLIGTCILSFITNGIFWWGVLLYVLLKELEDRNIDTISRHLPDRFCDTFYIKKSGISIKKEEE